MRTLVLLTAALVLAGCAGFPPTKSAGVHPTVWNRNAGINPEAMKQQQIVAMQAKQARCKSEVEARVGRDGTSPRDWKCKGPKQS
ncbi:MAG TPA: hypothetical protein VFN88_09760 [Caulobacteraceae bacterium]|nr:hypothetical protein [Caulobacteraceae bacterium]